MKWEYKTIRYEVAGMCSTRLNADEPDTQLNKLGIDEWELVATLHPSTDSNMNLLIFKRPAKERVSLPKKAQSAILEVGNGKLASNPIEKRLM
jgi:hypothetical protein